MRKLFIFSDVHSFFSELKDALDSAGFDINDPEHMIVSLGDLCDRGKESAEVLRFVDSIPDDRKICIIGNHELLMEEMITRGYPIPIDYHNGTLMTAMQLTGKTAPKSAIREMKHSKLWNKYKKSWQWYKEVGDLIFVHGWIPCDSARTKWGEVMSRKYDPDWRNASVLQWEEATWDNGMQSWAEGIKEPGKTVFCGHWHTSWGHSHLHDHGVEFVQDTDTFTTLEDGTVWPFACFDPFVDDGIAAMDACTVVSHKVNVIVKELETGE